MIRTSPAALFIAVPKCAGQSLKYLLAASGFAPVLMAFEQEELRLGVYRQGTAARLKERLSSELWQEAYKFCVCRNPYDRLVSAWAFCRSKQELDASFDDFVRNIESFDRYWPQWHGVMSQKRHVTVDGVPVVDTVFCLERLDEDFVAMRDRLDLQYGPLPHLNATPHPPYQSFYTRELQHRVYELFREDFEFFGYQYDLCPHSPDKA